MSSTHGSYRRSRGRVILLLVAVAMALIIFTVIWIAARALLARDQLVGAVPLARTVASSAAAGDRAGVTSGIDEVQRRTATAADLTSDPIWRAVENVPWVGNDLTAFREAAEMIHLVADDALPPLEKVANTFTVANLTPKGGTLDLQPFLDASPILGRARAALDLAGRQAEAIDTDNTIPQIGDAVDRIVDLVTEAKGTVDGLDTAAKLLPPMLGADGPRRYLLLSLNNAEVRATGGIAGAMVVITADGGRVSIGQPSSAATIGEFPTPVLPLTAAESTLFTDSLGLFVQDVNFTPDFARTGELAQAMWTARTGQSLDGVIAIDPVALGYLLKATGPIDVGSGFSLTSTNAAEVLLSRVYAVIPRPADQDAFFASVTEKVFSRVMSGEADSTSLVTALVMSGDEQRLHLWSAHADEQAQLAGTVIAGGLPVTSAGTSGFGVYLNDATGAKMSYYLRAAVSVASAVCRADRRPTFEVQVKLGSVAPVDSATSLPAYVTGNGVFGVPAGSVKSVVYVYAPKGALAYRVEIDGQPFAFTAADHDGRSVAGLEVLLAPGQISTVNIQFLGTAGQSPDTSLVHTALASPMSTSVDNYLDCSRVAPPRPDPTTGARGETASE